MINRMVGPAIYGGLVKTVGTDVPSMVRSFQQSSEVLKLWEGGRIREFLEAFASASPDFQELLDAFTDFEDHRNTLLPHLGELCVAPLAVATAPSTRALVTSVIESYRALVTKITSSYSALHQSFSDDARAAVELLMLLDTVFLDNGQSTVALATPVHPLLLWHYHEYAQVIGDQRDLLTERDRALVRKEFEGNGVPLFLASLGVPRTVSDRGPLSLPFSGKFGGLPHFSEHATARDPRDGLRSVERLMDAFVALHPSAAEGFRLALLEPPDAGVFLSLSCSMADAGHLRGAHITVLRRGQEVGAELNLSSDEERRVQQRFGNHLERRFTFETVRVGPLEVGPPAGITPHMLVAFDQTERHSADAAAPLQRVQPLVNRRRLVYRISTKSLDLEPAPGGILGEYSSMAKLAVGRNIVSYESVHQTDELEGRLREATKQVPWYVVADGRVDRDLDLGGLRVLTDQEGTREVAAFTRTPDAFRRALRDVVRQFNTYVTDEKLDVLLHALSNLLDAGLLSLRPGRSGEMAPSHAKGILGLLVAVESLKHSTPDGHDRIVLSLDSLQARRWLHLSEDPYRADLLVIDGADDRFTITAVEVKTRRDLTAEYSVVGGLIAGAAVTQLISTHRILRQVFDPNFPDQLITPSRREVLREHLYRELAKGIYDADTKIRWAHRSRELFDGTPDVDLRCALIDVQLGVAAATLGSSRDVHAADGELLIPVSVQHLNEDGVPALHEALTQPEIPPTDESEELEAAPPPSEPAAPVPVGVRPTPASSMKPGVPATEEEYRPRVLLGHTSTVGSGQPREVWFDPQNPDPDQQLNNPHISISGETGSGKTQVTKALLHEFRRDHMPVLVLDFKDDYSKPDYATAEGFVVHDASFGGLPFNPMVPPVDPQSGRVSPISHVHELGNMLQRIYKLGDQQAYQLREAMKETYSIAGVGFAPTVPDPEQQYLPFEAIREVLVREEATTLLGRLSPIFDLGLFSQGDTTTELDDLLSRSTVIRLSQLPGDQVKNAVAEFFLLALYSFVVRREQPHRLERLLVLDEAWRLVNSSVLVPLMRESRAFGLGIIVATQFPTDLPDHVAGSTATRLYFSQTKAEQVREIQRTLVGKTSGTEAEHLANLIRALAPQECVLQNRQHRPWARVRTIPYFARIAAESTPEEGE